MFERVNKVCYIILIMPCDLCGADVKTKRVSLTGFGIVSLCEPCHARLAAAYPGQRASIAREIAATRQRSLTK